MNGITQSLGLLLLAIVLLLLELFIPSGGLITVFAAAALIASMAAAFSHSVAFGTLHVIVTAVLVPTVVALMIRWWPHSAIGRLVLNIPPEGDARLSDAGTDITLGTLIGRVGTAKTKMLPSGAIRIDGRNYDAVTRGVAIEKGQYIEVVEVTGTRIVVVPVDEQRARAAVQEQTATPSTLSQPTEELIPDPFDDPLI